MLKGTLNAASFDSLRLLVFEGMLCEAIVHRLGSDGGYLFSGNSTHDALHGALDQAMGQIKSVGENAILNTPTTDLVAELQSKFEPEIPELQTADTWIEEKEVTTVVSDYGFDRSMGGRSITSHLVVFHVPFVGDGNIFFLQPSRRSLPGPVAEVRGQELLISVGINGVSEERVRQEFDQRAREIEEHLATVRQDLRLITAQIAEPAARYIEERRAQLLRNRNLVNSLGFPLKRRADAPTTYRAPDVQRKVVPTRPSVEPPFKPEPVLDEAEYQHILRVMDNMTRVMERSPHTFVRMGEEDIRQHFLVQLNGQYEGQATGETFNFEGKTDILIRSDGRNIFIAECKFWRGEKGFVETVDQLLGYLTWRDTKAAVLVFNQNKDLTAVLDAVQQAMASHPQFKRGPTREGETRFRYILGSPQDARREIIVTVMVYDIPST